MSPAVTIAIPTYNRGGLLGEAITSVLRQTFNDFELIVSDDCSTDDTAEVVGRFTDPRVRYHRTSGRLGVPGNWNECVRLAQGELFAILPDDDAYLPSFLDTMVHAIHVAGVGSAQCGLHIVDEKFRIIRTAVTQAVPTTLRGEDALIWQTRHGQNNPAGLLFRTSAMRQLGLWREDYWDDWAFIVKLSYRYGVTFIPEALSCVRVHSTNLSKQIVDQGFNNILNIFNQFTDVFGEALPATPRLIGYRSEQDRWLSRMCMIAALRQLQRGRISQARFYFSQARKLYALAGLDLGFLRLAASNYYAKRRDARNRLRARLRTPVFNVE